MRKLTNKQIEKIRELTKKGELTQKEIAKRFNVLKDTIRYYTNSKFRKKCLENSRLNFKKLSKEQRRRIYAKKRDYQREYHRERYKTDKIFREKQKKAAILSKLKKEKEVKNEKERKVH